MGMVLPPEKQMNLAVMMAGKKNGSETILLPCKL